MINNYFYIKSLSQKLDEAISGYTIKQCFSQEKDELIIGLLKGEKEFWIKAILKPRYNYLTFPLNFNRSKRNNINLFLNLIDIKVIGVEHYHYERAFSLNLEGQKKLLFKLFGSQSNILFFNSEKVEEIFHKKRKEDYLISIKELPKKLDLSLDAFKKKPLLEFCPLLPKEIVNQLVKEGYDKWEEERKWEAIKKKIAELDSPTFYIDSKKISPIPFENFDLKTQDPIQAVNEYYLKSVKLQTLQEERKKRLAPLKKELKRTENYLKKVKEKLEELNSEAESKFEKWANIIMANLHQIKKGDKEVELFDFYSNNQLIIKLNPKLSPQDNASVYYRKSKNRRKEIEVLEKNIESKNKKLEEIKVQIVQIEKEIDLKKLRKSNLINIKPQQKAKPYFEFTIGGFQIWAGKNAKSNEELTQKMSYKEDLWLHARDAKGSHVLIKHKAGKTYPTEVIEKAASIAAWNSERRGEKLCPVIFTPKKFVRKRKGDPIGMVVVDKEEVIMVEPVDPNIKKL